MDFDLKRLTANSADLPAAVCLYVSAFPACERRDVEEWVGLLDTERMFRLWKIEGEAGMFFGFISVWAFSGFFYVEHFAVGEAFRGNGCGAQALRLLQERISHIPIILEVELPETVMARRRIGFYERCGFRLSACEYSQPPYRNGDGWLPMCLMTTDEHFLNEHLEAVRATLYEKVYRQ